MISLITLLSIFLVVYHHLLYPLLLKYLATRQRAKQSKAASYTAPLAETELPTIELLLPAYNEQDYIEEKLLNLSILDYPADKLKVTVVCDGCQDHTAELARQTIASLGDTGFHFELIEQGENTGKLAILNRYIAQSTAEIVALSDISALISLDALSIAAQSFAKPQLGVVCSHYHLLNASSQEQQYWNYQRAIKQNEAELGAPLGAHGALYFIRRSAFQTLAADTINDDFILPLQIVAQGFSAEYNQNILALELEHCDQSQEQSRRSRIGAGNLQQVLRLGGLLHPRFKGLAFSFFSGKALRVFQPLLMLMALLGSALLSIHSGLFAMLFALQILAYALAALPALYPLRSWPKPIGQINYLVHSHISCALGALSYLAGGLNQRRTQRSSVKW